MEKSGQTGSRKKKPEKTTELVLQRPKYRKNKDEISYYQTPGGTIYSQHTQTIHEPFKAPDKSNYNGSF